MDRHWFGYPHEQLVGVRTILQSIYGLVDAKAVIRVGPTN